MSGPTFFIVVLLFLLMRWVHVTERNGKDERIMDLYIKRKITAEEAAYVIGVPIEEFQRVVNKYIQGDL